jgi:hypothetical protein
LEEVMHENYEQYGTFAGTRSPGRRLPKQKDENILLHDEENLEQYYFEEQSSCWASSAPYIDTVFSALEATVILIAVCLLIHQKEAEVMLWCSILFYFIMLAWVFAQCYSQTKGRSYSLAAEQSFVGAPLMVIISALCVWLLLLDMNAQSPDHQCQTALGYCSTISCICANIVGNGYAFLLVMITMNSHLTIQGLRDIESEVRPTFLSSCFAFECCMKFPLKISTFGLAITTFSAVFPAAAPHSALYGVFDSRESMTNAMVVTHTVSVTIGFFFVWIEGCLATGITSHEAFSPARLWRGLSPSGKVLFASLSQTVSASIVHVVYIATAEGTTD